MSPTTINSRPADRWLKHYYAVRALFSAVWVALAFTIGNAQPPIAVVLIVAYPLWDCLANIVDASRSGGLRVNPSQMLNTVVSAIVTLGVAVTLPYGYHPVIAVIGVWAILSGILQLATAFRRWHSAAAQWPMILSGAQSALAGAFFVKQAADPSTILGVADVAPYAAFGAIYFAISALVLLVRGR
jgi:uncharacterized membrane protein HdeD (DUF308 family)